MDPLGDGSIRADATAAQNRSQASRFSPMSAPSKVHSASSEAGRPRPSSPRVRQLSQAVKWGSLLPEPGGFEGLGSIRITLPPREHPVSDRVLVRDPILDRNATALPPGGDAHEDQHPLVVDLEEPLRLERQGAAPGRGIRKSATPLFQA